MTKAQTSLILLLGLAILAGVLHAHTAAYVLGALSIVAFVIGYDQYPKPNIRVEDSPATKELRESWTKKQTAQ